MQKLLDLLKSRKFWALVAALVAVAAAYFPGQISVWQAVQAVVAALSVYALGVAVEDAGARAGGG